VSPRRRTVRWWTTRSDIYFPSSDAPAASLLKLEPRLPGPRAPLARRNRRLLSASPGDEPGDAPQHRVHDDGAELRPDEVKQSREEHDERQPDSGGGVSCGGRLRDRSPSRGVPPHAARAHAARAGDRAREVGAATWSRDSASAGPVRRARGEGRAASARRVTDAWRGTSALTSPSRSRAFREGRASAPLGSRRGPRAWRRDSPPDAPCLRRAPGTRSRPCAPR
jgi:hypothetical protein